MVLKHVTFLKRMVRILHLHQRVESGTAWSRLHLRQHLCRSCSELFLSKSLCSSLTFFAAETHLSIKAPHHVRFDNSSASNRVDLWQKKAGELWPLLSPEDGEWYEGSGLVARQPEGRQFQGGNGGGKAAQLVVREVQHSQRKQLAQCRGQRNQEIVPQIKYCQF